MSNVVLRQETAREKAVWLILGYWRIRKQMIDLTKRIKNEYVLDTGSDEYGGKSNHIHDYFEADKEWRSAEGYSMEFSEYCCDVLGMDDVCPQCAHMLEMIRKRRQLGKKLGYAKGKIMRLGMQIDLELMALPEDSHPRESATFANDAGCISCQENEIASPQK